MEKTEEKYDDKSNDIGSFGSFHSDDESLHDKVKDDAEEQLFALIEALRLLTQKILRPLQKNKSIDDAFHAIQPEDIEIAKISTKWSLEETGFTALSNAVMQMRDVLHFSHVEADAAYQEAQQFKIKESDSRMKISELKYTIVELSKENKMLKKALKKKNKDWKIMRKSMKIMMKQNEHLNEERVLAIMDLHDRIVSRTNKDNESYQKQGSVYEGDVNENDDDNHVDNDEVIDNQVDRTNQIIIKESNDNVLDNNDNDNDDDDDDDDDESSISSTSINSSASHILESLEKELNTSELEKELQSVTLPDIDIGHYNNEDRQNKFSNDKRKGPYRIMFSNKIGLQFQKVPLEDHNKINSIDKNEMLFNKIMSNRTIHLEDEKVEVTVEEEKDDDEPCSSDFSISSHAILVCGTQGFDEVGNGTHPPTIGARLIGLNDYSFERGVWALDDVRKLIADTPKPICMTFRDDPLMDFQKTLLSKASRKTVIESEPNGSENRKKIRQVNAFRRQKNHINGNSIRNNIRAASNAFKSNHAARIDRINSKQSLMTSYSPRGVNNYDSFRRGNKWKENEDQLHTKPNLLNGKIVNVVDKFSSSKPTKMLSSVSSGIITALKKI